MDRVEHIVKMIFAEELNPGDLSLNDMELVLDYLQDCAEHYVGTDKHEMAVAMLEVLAPFIDNKLAETDMSDFSKAVEQAEARGSTYFEFENYSLH